MLKIFKIDEETWWAAESAQAAIEDYERETGEEVARDDGSRVIPSLAVSYA